MKIYIVRTGHFWLPVVLGYYSTRSAAQARLDGIVADAAAEEEEYPLYADSLIIEEVTVDQDINPTLL